MDYNFADLKKEATATTEQIFDQAEHAYDDLLSAGDIVNAGNVSSGAQDDNAHTEHYFANEQKNLDFSDPQAFVQRMSAGAKEAQEQLDAKFSQKTEEIDDFLKEAGQSVKQNISDLTHDFMNAERGIFGAVASPPGPVHPVDAPPAPPVAAPTVAPSVAAPPVAAPAIVAPVQEADLLGSFSEKPSTAPLQPFEATAPSKSNFYDDEYDDDDYLAKPAPAAVSKPSNKDSDTESPSVSCTPSPAKKPIADALKEQDNEKFISSEDLLSDFKEERAPLPPVKITAPPPVSVAAVPIPAAALITDLDADDDFKPAKVEPKVEPPKPIVEPPKPKVEPAKPPKAVPVTLAASENQNQPKIVSVEELFYKLGLVESLIYWRDVKKSGIVFGAGLITLVAISWFSVISVFAYLSLLALFGTVAFRIYKSVTQAVQKTNDGHPFKEYLELDLTLSQEKVQNIAGVAVAHLNGFTAELRRLFLVEDLIDSIKFGVILWVFTYIGAWFNGMTLVILAFVSLFTLPKVYENNKQSIDTYLDLVRSKLTEITDKIRVAIPIGNKKPVAAAATESDKDK
ncbi:reticulon-1 isoform X2 [Drosophila tropicalis]|uniref:reticulon-1 isoform X2 n=1 Tax=Drosophila tropicalis TaxID=46794 RepID=UPI0035ABE92E